MGYPPADVYCERTGGGVGRDEGQGQGVDDSSTAPATREPASATAHTRHATRPFSHARPFAACARYPRADLPPTAMPMYGTAGATPGTAHSLRWRRRWRWRCLGRTGGVLASGTAVRGRGPRPRRPLGQRTAHSPMAWLEGGRGGTAALMVAHGAVTGGQGARRRRAGPRVCCAGAAGSKRRRCWARVAAGPAMSPQCPLAMAPRPSLDTPPPTRRDTGPTTAQQREHPRRRTGLRRGK